MFLFFSGIYLYHCKFLFLLFLEDDSDSKMIDGLSIERLTLLGRAKVARVTVDALNLLSPISDAKPERKSAASNKSLGRPPKPKLLPQKSK